MIIGTHILFYSANPEADRRFFRDVLGFRCVDDGGGWLIFAVPPAEAAFHPSEGEFVQEHAGHRMMGAIVYLMCDDLQSTVKRLEAKSVKVTEIEEEPWGIRTTVPLPGGGEIGLYQPAHATAFNLGSSGL